MDHRKELATLTRTLTLKREQLAATRDEGVRDSIAFTIRFLEQHIAELETESRPVSDAA